MCLHVHSDASYLSKSKARSCAGGIFFLSSFPSTAANAPPPKFNGAIHIVSSIMRNVLSSATEAEVGACFHNAQDACPLRVTLKEMNWPQPPTPIQVDNSCAHGIINDTNPKLSTCASIGYATVSAKATSASIGNPANPTLPITSQNTTPRNIIGKCAQITHEP
jgi:hypothetical protein